MGYYINPSNGKSKEQFLNSEGIKVDQAPRWGDIPSDKVAVCLVDNGMFTAAGVMYSQRELEEWAGYNDGRPYEWYIVSKNAVIANSDWDG